MTRSPLYFLHGSIYLLPLLVPRVSARPNRSELNLADSVAFSDFSTRATTIDSVIATPTNLVLLTAASQPTATPGATSTTSSVLNPTLESSPSSTSESSNAHNAEIDHDRGIVNLYFLLLGIFVALLIFVYWLVARRQRTRKLAMATRRQDALAADLNRRLSAGQSQSGRLDDSGRMVGDEARTLRNQRNDPSSLNSGQEEGLDDRGVAPPPYLAKVPNAVIVDSHRGDDEHGGIELQNLEHMEGSAPPGYSPLATPQDRTA